MPALHEVQARFAHAVFGHGEEVLRWIRGNGLDPTRRLQVYRNNTEAGLAEALRETFPVVHRLVGDFFFQGMARAYLRRHPPASGCLLDFGGEFPGFIEGFPPAATLAYLPDVARLEWAFHSAYHAADAEYLTTAALQVVPTERYDALRLRLHPSIRLLASPWPVLRIFAINQPDYEGRETLDLRREGGCRVLAIRPDLDVALHPLELGEFAFLTALERDGDLGAAFASAAAIEPGFDLTRALLVGFDRGVFSAIGY